MTSNFSEGATIQVQRTAKLTITAALLALISLSFSACGGGGNSDSKDSLVAATVNGKNIMLSEVEKLINQQMQGQQSQLSPLQVAQARLQVLETLIQKEVLLQRAEKENLKPTEDEISQYINAKKQEGRLTEEEFQKQLSLQGQTEQALREEARKLIAIQKLQAKYMGSVSISDRQVEDYYLKNKEGFTIGKGVELAHIVADPRDNGGQDDAKSEAEAKLKIDNIYQQLKGGDFAEVAYARSEDQSRERGGDIGFATEDQLKQAGFPDTVVSSLFGPMQVGNYTEPVQFNGRWFIFKLKRKQLETENRTLESPGVRQEITEALRSQHQQLLNSILLEVALREAKIVNKLASTMLETPSNLGLRPASPGAVPPAAVTTTPAAAATTTPQTPAAAASPAVAGPGASPKANASPKL